MRIKPGEPSPGDHSAFEAEISKVIANPGVEGRVCGKTCTIRCSACGSLSCQCMCHCECPDASARLSSDPVRHPLEPGIVPLVFAMKRDGGCTPCWSCEGHEKLDGAICKIPRVWFYCQSNIYLRLINEGVSGLHAAKQIHAPWHIVITHSDPGNADTAFSLEPVLPPDSEITLNQLRADILTIAKAFTGFVKMRARSLGQSVAQHRKQALGG